MMPMNWSSAANQLSLQGKAYVLVTLVGVSGSTPRNSGTKMVISQDEIFDTIGGGHLEHKATKYARSMLVKGKNDQQLEHFQLASNLGQCCGGNASVLFECFAAVGVNIMLFGAGHVGKALIPILAGLPCHVTWVDSREEQFPTNIEMYQNVTKVVSEEPEFEVASMPANSYFVVMTHNHQMDFEITQAVLKRGNFSYLGLIASDTKRRRFLQRYKHREVDPVQVARMSCPIGLEQVGGKLPMEVAISVAGEIVNLYQAEQKAAVERELQLVNVLQQDASSTLPKPKSVPATQQGIFWKEFKALLNAD
ncbi:xanthine dehydrogenase accessory protein XdhC [Shewanella sp. D64]|uniref:xanthine dehydrogenase accessory protein XdhC n=1 Tax=unclassified Shewanella TaxID=196818 RepID=UPI0022BA2799|nr:MULTISPECIES: xanthine dehydrogenase accessory protein XdhC [unclassified Shewanella]MEC4725231.1 xanthine dehydrogenase accessory protein XdhC [Shewanella sp. D64]MEC4735923.1 xanthine dehydrogenase accessory protein XdhC [Shewanella sp. E94]WBJ93110.1 xanthine dehydrogenase accessory protein XdhC [Shewanella sp. MTB7]